jgi:LysM repeat protein
VLVLLIALQAALGRSDGGPLTTIGSAGGAQPAVAHLYVVKPGDTLWSIALASGAKGDIRPLVDRLSAEVQGRPLQPGQQILVP